MKTKMSKLYLALLATTSTALSHPILAAENEDTERMEVVGSRIKRTDIEGPLPVQTIDRDTIEKSGYNNLQQLLVRLPTAGNGTFSTRGNNQDSTANGAAAVSLRGLGADATLVLINGRRVAVSSFAEGITTNFVDINSIPVSAIERVEILKDGASAVYGSDAVAGVVNVVLRKDFTGTEVSLGYGNTTDTDADEKTASFIWGVGGDNGNATIIFDYFSNNTLMNSDRGSLGTANQAPRGGDDLRSSRGFPGTFIVDGVPTIDPGCAAENVAGAICVYDYGPWNVLTPAAERVGVMLIGNRQVGSNLELFTEIGVQHNKSFAQGAPTPLDGDAQLTVPTSHPNNPFAGATTIDILRFRTVDAGARRWDIETDNLRAVLGARGNIGDWDWEASVQRARSESTQTGNKSQGWVRTDLLQEEINAGRYNPFGGTYNSPDVINAITTNLVRQGESHLTAYDVNFTGDLFETDHGAIAMAVGAEYREEDVQDVPDDQFQRGLIFGTESVSAAASRDHKALFAELSVPLMDRLELQIAGRFDDYSDFGSTTNPKVALRWAPADNVALRASWSTGFRAPSLAQIGLGPSQESIFIDDDYGCPVPDGNNPACATTDLTVVFAGNPDLDAEESESWNVGAIWEITDDLSLSLDYWSIVQDNKIERGDINQVYADNCDNQASTVCVRNAPLPGYTLGAISRIQNTFYNLTSQEAQGLDLSANYKLDLAESGTVNFTLDWTYLENIEKDDVDWTGKYEYPEIRWLGAADWAVGDWGVNASVSYIGEFEDYTETRTVDSMMTLNLQARYSGIKDVLVSVGIDNALDEEVPFAIGDGDSDLYGYVSALHDPRGQFVYGKVTYSF
ncbi:MAG: TonB-dependent receptor plug domain-containing protein [Permianibacter sp.]